MTSLGRYLWWWAREEHPCAVFLVVLVGAACAWRLVVALAEGRTVEILMCLVLLVFLALFVATEAIAERVSRRTSKRRGPPRWRSTT